MNIEEMYDDLKQKDVEIAKLKEVIKKMLRNKYWNMKEIKEVLDEHTKNE